MRREQPLLDALRSLRARVNRLGDRHAAERVARALEDAAQALRALGAGLRDGRAEQ